MAARAVRRIVPETFQSLVCEKNVAQRVAEDFVSKPAEEIFERLLTTWPLRFERWLADDVKRPAPENEKSNEVEKRYGDGHFDDRRTLLRVALEHLQKANRTDLPVVFIVLALARDQSMSRSLARAKLLTDRELRVRPANTRRRRVIGALTALRQDVYGIEVPALIDHLLGQLNSLNLPINKLKHARPLATVDERVRQDLSRAGVPTHLRGWRQSLARAGCHATPKNLREALLMAVGLIPYRKG